MINDTMIRYTPDTGYPVTKVKRRRRVRPLRPSRQPLGQTMLRWAMLALAGVLGLMALLWLTFGVASHIPALQAQHRAEQAAAALVADWNAVPGSRTPTPGQAWATISIPTIGVKDVVVFEGTEAEQIDVGVGHYLGTDFPSDSSGNVALAGHRTGWGQPFNRLSELRRGDAVIIETADGVHTYTVTGSAVVELTETWVLGEVPAQASGASRDSQLLTLTTCEGDRNQERLIVWAELTDFSVKG
jgi:sortase A